jgi:alkylated DNA repair dioxygenase AlkB
MALQFKFFDGVGDEDPPQPLEGFRYRPELIGQADEAALVARVRELPFREFEFHGYTGKRRVVSFGWKYDFSGRQLLKADDIPEFLLPLRALAASFSHMDPAALQQALVTEYRPGAGIGWHRDKAEFGQVVGISLLSTCVLRFRHKVSENPSHDQGARQFEGFKMNRQGKDKYRTGSGSDRVSTQPKWDDKYRTGSGSDRVSTQPKWDDKYRTGSGSDRVVKKQLPARVKAKREWERVNVLAEPRSAYHLSGPARLVWEHSILRMDSLRYSITFRNVLED